MEEIFIGKKISIIITLFILIAGTIMYLTVGESSDRLANISPEIFKQLELKSAYIDGNLKLFAYAEYNELAKISASEGVILPESKSIFIGYAEANMMKKEKLFSKIGDKIDNFFGINVVVSGILAPTNSILDDIHFLSEKNFDLLNGDEDISFIRLKGNEPKLFYTYRYGEDSSLRFEFEEGSLEYYSVHDIADVKYYPVILGKKEADMMRKEGIFKNNGDIIKDFFGRNIIIAGILKETDSALDMAHIIPLSSNEIGDSY